MCSSNRDDCKLENTVKQSRFKHLPTLPKVPKAGSMTMVLMCFIGQQTRLTYIYMSTFSHLADTFIQSDLQLGVHKAIHLEYLNPIENLCIVKRKMKDTRPNNADDPKATIKATWASLHLSSATGWLSPCHAALMQ